MVHQYVCQYAYLSLFYQCSLSHSSLRHWCFVMEWFIFRPMSNVFIQRLCNINPFSHYDTTSLSFENCSYSFSSMISLIICTHLYTSSKELYKATGANLIPLGVLKSGITFFCFNALHILAASGCSIKTCAPRSTFSIGLQITK